ncbi:hypothetical protein C2S51_027021 [Perilla frutescens var. frutescens]|nr:hypothetical protein C2S51_027021 [Perilla frutescens var. frutescens]
MKTADIPRVFSLCLVIWSSIFFTISCSTDAINAVESIKDGETLVSAGGTFELGFFSPENSSNRYVGIWYKNLSARTVVWVANRQDPIKTRLGVLKVIERGIMIILNNTNGTVWSSFALTSVQNPVAQLQESGNLVVREADDDHQHHDHKFVWQSFDFPCDTLLPGMKIGWNFVTGSETYLSSWKSHDDPARGEFTSRLDPTGYPQLLLKRGADVVHRIGPRSSREDTMSMFAVVMDGNEVYYEVYNVYLPFFVRFTIDERGEARFWRWDDGASAWMLHLKLGADRCDEYGMCGVNGVCDVGKLPFCRCLDGFVPKDPEGWSRSDWSRGCIRRTYISCHGGRFLRYTGMKLPDAKSSWNNASMRLEECRAVCLQNCSCSAYAQLDVERGMGCLLWYGDLVDIRTLALGGQDVYIRMASSELGIYNGSSGEELEIPFFKLSTIMEATNHFSIENKLGEGGFGSVYKGTLQGGKEIAVKRLSQNSLQGLDELKNEVLFIAKLQHRNLVNLVGFCNQREESMLIYEYMPNKSLDLILFDETKRNVLGWKERLHIINGIARGLMYLHQDSRLRIIHRDLKASNILLDSDMSPKISDFGLARSFGRTEVVVKTRRVIGTYGYMSPEYVVDGLFSAKSDVYSFGVLVIEIISGKRNWGFSHHAHNLNLLGHAWTLYKEGRLLELVDACVGDPTSFSQVMRSIQIGLLCVQQNVEDRPSMCGVVAMLENEGVIPQAKQPGFFTARDVLAAQAPTSGDRENSINEVTISTLEPR